MLISKIIPPVLNKILESIIKCIIAITLNAKCENIFQSVCKNITVDHKTLLFHTQVNWQGTSAKSINR